MKSSTNAYAYCASHLDYVVSTLTLKTERASQRKFALKMKTKGMQLKILNHQACKIA